MYKDDATQGITVRRFSMRSRLNCKAEQRKLSAFLIRSSFFFRSHSRLTAYAYKESCFKISVDSISIVTVSAYNHHANKIVCQLYLVHPFKKKAQIYIFC